MSAIKWVQSDTVKPGIMPRIPHLYAFLSVDPQGDEGVMGYKTEAGWMPMVAADERRLDSLKEVARQIVGSNPGHTVRLVKFTVREDILQLESEG